MVISSVTALQFIVEDFLKKVIFYIFYTYRVLPIPVRHDRYLNKLESTLLRMYLNKFQLSDQLVFEDCLNAYNIFNNSKLSPHKRGSSTTFYKPPNALCQVKIGQLLLKKMNT